MTRCGNVERAKLHWEAVVDSLPELICLIDVEGRIVRCNRTIAHWGFGEIGEVVGAGLHARLHPDCSDETCYLRQALEQSGLGNGKGETTFDEHLGRHIHYKATPVQHEEHAMDDGLTLLVLNDETLRIENERRASSTEEKLQLLVDSVSDLILKHDYSGTLHYVSSSCQNLLGYNPATLLGRNLFDLVHDEDIPTLVEYFSNHQDDDAGDVCLFRVVGADGENVWVEASSHQVTSALFGGDVVTILRDVTARHREEEMALAYSHRLEQEVNDKTQQLTLMVETLRRQNEDSERNRKQLETLWRRYTSLVENTLTGIYMRQKNRIVFCNERFANIFGYSRNEIINMNICELLISGEDDCEVTELHLEINEAMAHSNLIEGRRSNGAQIWIKMSRARIENEDGVFILGNVIDVSEQVRIQDELRHSEQALHRLSSLLINAQENERKRIANELHDGVGQRLSAIKFSVEDVVRSCQDESRNTQQMERLEDVVTKIRDTIEEVRRTSMDLRPSILDDLGLVATINWFCREFSGMLPGIELVKEVEVEEQDIANELKVVIFRIMQEALHNISKYAGASCVAVSLKKHNESLVLSIQDDGCGFAVDCEVVCGSGLGLKSMRERTELMGGCFEIVSSQDDGTLVTASWPCDKSLSKERPGPMPQGLCSSLRSAL